jgi:hypothetical protein
MSTINWTDQVTPLNAVNMNSLEQVVRKNAASGYVGLDASSNIAFASAQKIVWNADTSLARIGNGALGVGGGIYVQSTPLGVGFSYGPATFTAGNVAFQSTVSGEANARLSISHGGDMKWGPGGATAADTTLARSAAGVLKAGQNFRAGLDLYAQDGGATQVRIGNNGGTASVDFGSAMDARLYRAGAGQLKTDGSLYVVGTAGIGLVFNPPAASGQALASLAPGDTSYRFNINVNGQQQWGPGNAVSDTILYRAAASTLKTDGALQTGSTILASAGSGNQVVLGYNGVAGAPAIAFGSTYDTNLYRAAAAVLKTDGAIATTAYGTSLPASPVDGQEYTLVDSLTAPTYAWRFRYVAGSTLAWKWEFIGGSSTHTLINLAESPLTNVVGSWTWCSPTPGPDFIVPRTGIYRVRIGAQITGPAGGGVIGIAAANINAGPLGAYVTVSIPSNGMQFPASYEGTVNVSAGDTLRLVVYQYAASTTFGSRTIAVTPVRVS